MSAKKDALSAARLLLRASRKKDGGISAQKAKSLVKRIGDEKPRNYLSILSAFQRLLRLELEAAQAKVESAVEIDEVTKKSLEKDLRSKYGKELEVEYSINEELIGGMRVRVGSDVWDSTVKSRLDRLSLALS